MAPGPRDGQEDVAGQTRRRLRRAPRPAGALCLWAAATLAAACGGGEATGHLQKDAEAMAAQQRTIVPNRPAVDEVPPDPALKATDGGDPTERLRLATSRLAALSAWATAGAKDGGERAPDGVLTADEAQLFSDAGRLAAQAGQWLGPDDREAGGPRVASQEGGAKDLGTDPAPSHQRWLDEESQLLVDLAKSLRQGAQGGDAARADELAGWADTLASSMWAQQQPADRSKYRFSQVCFDAPMKAWVDRTRHLRGKPIESLEIGSFEGASTTWILDELMSHPDATLVAVDTFAGAIDHRPRPGGPDDQLATLFERFEHNVKVSGRGSQLRTLKMSLIDAAVTLRHEERQFDFIYIDGSHSAGDVLHDAVALWPMLKLGGTLVFDDYHWKLYAQPFYSPTIAIDAFLQCFAPELSYVVDTGQVWVTRRANTQTPIVAQEW